MIAAYKTFISQVEGFEIRKTKFVCNYKPDDGTYFDQCKRLFGFVSLASDSICILLHLN